jgi:hypothetical protein
MRQPRVHPAMAPAILLSHTSQRIEIRAVQLPGVMFQLFVAGNMCNMMQHLPHDKRTTCILQCMSPKARMPWDAMNKALSSPHKAVSEPCCCSHHLRHLHHLKCPHTCSPLLLTVIFLQRLVSVDKPLHLAALEDQ